MGGVDLALYERLLDDLADSLAGDALLAADLLVGPALLQPGENAHPAHLALGAAAAVAWRLGGNRYGSGQGGASFPTRAAARRGRCATKAM